MSKDPNIIVPKNKVIKPEDITLSDLEALSNDSFPIWALTSGAKVDGHPVDFNRHRYLLPIYMNNDRVIVWRKAAQLGASSYLLLRVLWWLYVNQGRKAGLYFPTKEGVENLSKDRLTPLIKSVDLINEVYDDSNKLGLRSIGESSFYLMHLGGTASKDSVPLDLIAFDEVRLVSSKDIDQARERISHSEHKFELYMSTAGLPNLDIDMRYQRGTQHSWRSKCRCESWVNLAETFPECVINTPKHGLQLQCPKCKCIIKDPQNGRYEAANPTGSYTSYHVSQLVSKFISLEEIWDVYNHTTNIQEFYNAKLGLPYIDKANQGVGIDALRNCVNPEIQWGANEVDKKERRCAMGVDVGAGYAFAVIMDYSKDGKPRIKHIELIEQDNPEYYENGTPVTPFKRLYSLMDEYNVKICVCDAMPNADLSMEFQRAFAGRVYLAWYFKGGKDPVTWGDRGKMPLGLAKAGPLMKSKYKVVLDRYISIDRTLGLFREQDIEIPDPRNLVQMAKVEKGENRGRLEPEAVCERLFDHLTRAIRKVEVINEETQEQRIGWIYAGGDPHLLHATNYCVTALDRLSKSAASFSFI